MKTPLHYQVAARQSEIAELEQIGRASVLVGSMSRLVHVLQKERGLSNLFLASGGSSSAQELLEHELLVDSAMVDVCLALEVFGERLPGVHGARLFNAIAYALQGFAALPDGGVRGRGQRLRPRYRAQAGGLVSLQAGQGTRGPGARDRSRGLCERRWLHLIESQERCFQVFEDFASEAGAARWRQLCGVCADMAVIERLRCLGCTAAGLDSKLSEPWFAACSSRLDAMHQIEAWLVQELQARCLHQLDLARAALARQQGMAAEAEPGAELFFSAPGGNRGA